MEIDHTAIIDTKGVEANANSRVVVTNSVVEHVATHGITADFPTAQVHVSTTDFSFNTNGITATLGGNALVASSSLDSNSSCSFNNNGGSGFFTYGDNELTGTGTCGTITPTAKQ